MNAYDKAHELAKILKRSVEYTQYCQVRDKLKENEKALRMFQDMRKKEMELGQKQMLGQEIPEEELEQFQKQREVATLHSVIKDFLAKEERLHIFMMDIQKIIGEALDIGIDDEEGDS